MIDAEIIKALEILEKFNFFQGQRAGRELWNEKPIDVQDEDIENFVEDVAFLEDFIKRQQAEIADLKTANFVKTDMINYLQEKFENAKDEAVKEFAKSVKFFLTGWFANPTDEEIEYTIDSLLKEMVGESNDR